MRTKQSYMELAVCGGAPAFKTPRHVNRPALPSYDSFANHVETIFKTRQLTNDGPLVRMLERRLAQYLNVEHCLLVSNGTTALQIAAQALQLSGEVIMPSLTFIATAHALKWLGIDPIFCDVDPDDFTLDPNYCESLISEKTSGILGVHLWGTPCHVEALESIARKHSLKLLFDAAHAIGCSYGNQRLGVFGDAEVFSFHATKVLHTFEGGAITTNSDRLANRIRSLRNFGFVDYDTIEGVGINGKMSEISAAIGLENLSLLDQYIDNNRVIQKCYKECLENTFGVMLTKYQKTEQHNCHYVVLDIDREKYGVGRDTLLAILHAENILARRYFYPGCHRSLPYRTTRQANLPVTESLGDRLLVLPAGPSIDKDDIPTICSVVSLVSQLSAPYKSELEQRVEGAHSLIRKW